MEDERIIDGEYSTNQDCTVVCVQGDAVTSRAAVVGASVVAFADGFTVQEQDDVLNSLSFAQAKASEAYNRLKQPVQWLNEFGMSLIHLDWVADAEVFNAVVPNKKYYLSLEQAALEHLTVLKSPALVSVITRALQAMRLDTFAKGLLESHSGSGQLSSVQYVPCERRGGKDSYMYVSFLHATAITRDKKPVHNAQQRVWALDVLSGGIGFYLQHEAYAQHRERVLKHLEDRQVSSAQNIKL